MASASDYRDILVVAQVHEGRVLKTSLEVLTKARELADQLGARVEALVLGDAGLEAVAEEIVHNGADVVHLGEHESLSVGAVDAFFAAALPVVKDRKPEILLMSANPLGLDLAPRLGAALGTGALSDATKLEIDETDRLLIAKRATYDGSIEAVATIPKHRPQIASLRPGAVRVGFPDSSRYGRVEKADVEIPRGAARVTLLSMEDSPVAEVALEDAEVVVAAGLGLAKSDLHLAQDLAKALGGAWGVSRAAVQFGHAPKERQVGATGVHVKPKLYVAAGISGQFEHYLGVRESEFIVAINPDKKAPIMRVARYGLVGDAKEIIPKILDELKRD
ncbi:MAG: electron transfer flavoprotein subunit alpha/FixB family protein [Thermoplasmatota archaeon]